MTTETTPSRAYTFDPALLWLVLVGLYPLFEMEHVEALVRWLNEPPRSGRLTVAEDEIGGWFVSQTDGSTKVFWDGQLVDTSVQTMAKLHGAACRLQHYLSYDRS